MATLDAYARDVSGATKPRNVVRMKAPGHRYLKRLADLKSERSTWDAHGKELCEHLQPKRNGWDEGTTVGAKGGKVNSKIINSTPLLAVRTAQAGMHASMSSPARPWFRLTTPDPEMSEFGPVRAWLHLVEERIRMTFLRSNIYNILPTLYTDLNWIGTAAALFDDDDETVVRGYSYLPGQYWLSVSDRLEVDTLFREFKMTTLGMVTKFGLDEVSVTVRNQYKEGKYDEQHKVCHVVEPNRDVDGELVLTHRAKPWRSCWFESSRDPEEQGGRYLRESGYWDKPFVAPRWDIALGAYGRGPGMDALGDAKSLQYYELKKAEVVEKIVNPPMKGPPALMSGRASLRPGDITLVAENASGAKFEPAVVVHPQAVTVVLECIREDERRCAEAFHADLWRSMEQLNDSQPRTAREIQERHEEKLAQLGPVLERLQDEMYDPIIDRYFGVLLRRGELPPPPEELSNVELRVDYTSPMAQAQKFLSTTGIERLSSFVGNLAAVVPSVLDKLNTDELVDTYADMLGTKPDLVRSDDVVAELRAKQAQAQQQQAALEQAQMAAQGAKTLSEADTEGDNGLTRMLGALGGVAGATA